MADSGSPTDTNTFETLRIVPVYNVVEGLATYLNENLCKLALMDRYQPINIIFRCYGGDVDESIACVDAMQVAKALLRGDKGKIYGQVHGHCMSAGVFLLQYCNERWMTSHSHLMVHGISSRFGGDRRNIENNKRFIDDIADTYLQTFLARTNKPKKFWKPIMEADTNTFFTAKEALDIGLVDKVVEVVF